MKTIYDFPIGTVVRLKSKPTILLNIAEVKGKRIVFNSTNNWWERGETTSEVVTAFEWSSLSMWNASPSVGFGLLTEIWSAND